MLVVVTGMVLSYILWWVNNDDEPPFIVWFYAFLGWFIFAEGKGFV
jgi:hypothetical protein